MKRQTPRLLLCQDVLEALDEELEYINSLPSYRADEEDHGVAGQLVTLERYARKAADAWADNPGNTAALENIRKIAGTAIRALILYGCPKRQFQIQGSRCPVCGDAEHDNDCR